jgi:integrative and conjugative element protein (TIGR02256 family)
MFFEAPGRSVAPNALVLPKALDFASYLAAAKHPYATLIDTRRDDASGVETVVLDVAVELSQDRVNAIWDRERIAISFFLGDVRIPEVVALREDFPWVPHLNQREEEFPRSLCLYEAPYSTLKLRWTATLLVERVREWLSLSADGRLHQEDQPLENVFLGHIPPLILPSDFIKSLSGDSSRGVTVSGFGVHAVGDNLRNITGFVVTDPSIHNLPAGNDHVATAVVAPPRKHGMVRHTPRNLRQIIDIMREVDIDLIDVLRQRLRSWKEEAASTADARFLLLLVFPKFREEGSPQETWEWDTWGFLFVDGMQQLGTKLGLWEMAPNRALAMLIPPAEERSAQAEVQIVNPVLQLTKSRAALFNGTVSDDRNMVMVGVGALGSILLERFLRKGFGFWTLIDDDLMMPHNGARHCLPAIAAGAPKVTAMSQLAGSFYEATAVKAVSRANVLHPGSEVMTQSTIMSDASVIFDCSADVAVARLLALDVPGAARRLSLFLSPNGKQLVLLLEDAERKQMLDTLEMQFYRLLLDEPQLQTHYMSTGPRIRYGRSCRDLSAILSADHISMFAGIGSKAAEKFLRTPDAAIVVWKAESDFSVLSIKATPRRVFRSILKGFTVLWDEAVVDKIRWLRGEKLPGETGGALVGCWDLSRQMLYIVDVTGAPPDSVERPTAFIRGSKDLGNWIAEISRLTGRTLEYVGEWHSHPDGFSTRPSCDDRNVFRWIEDHLATDGLPSIMLIAGDSDFRWMSEANGNGCTWEYRS